MNRISKTFSELQAGNRKALIPFITAGDPDPALTVELMHQLVKSGSNIVELGIPFSDPMADGPTIQRSSERALKHHVGLNDVLQIVSKFREIDHDTPVVLMGYANPIEAMGYEKFAVKAKECGVDGILIVDYPLEECAEWVQCLNRYDIDAIFLLSPTTPPDRVRQVAAMAKGYVYYVSLKGVTGASHLDLKDVETMLAQLRKSINIPIGVGFGIRDGETARAVAQLADAVVVGSRIIEEIEKSPTDAVLENVGKLINILRSAIDKDSQNV